MIELVEAVRYLLGLGDEQVAMFGLFTRLLSGVGLAEEDRNALFDEDVEVVEIVEKLEIHIDYLVVGGVVPAHLVEHLLRLQNEIHQIHDLEPMRHHLYFCAVFQFTEMTHEVV